MPSLHFLVNIAIVNEKDALLQFFGLPPPLGLEREVKIVNVHIPLFKKYCAMLTLICVWGVWRELCSCDLL